MKKKIIFAIMFLIIGASITYAADLILSSDIYFDNTSSTLKATNVQDAIDEIYDKCGNNSSISEPVSFAEDSWETIISNVKAGNINAYNVGDTKEIELTGFTNEEEDSNGLYTIRIANMSTPEECSTEGYSQTACGFVIEFVDAITTQTMNQGTTNAGGWRDGIMRSYVNYVIYNSLPKELRDNIMDTYVVSGYGGGDNDKVNIITNDKIYLLSTEEVWGSSLSGDTASSETRQLDYYANLNVTTSNYSNAIKTYNGSSYAWWLRTAYKGATNSWHTFSAVNSDGSWFYKVCNVLYGVAPAFRIG